MNKRADLRETDMLRIARIMAVQSAAAAFAQTEHDTQLSIERGYIWLINMIEFGVSLLAGKFDPGITVNDVEFNQFQITRESQSEIVNLNDTAVVCNHQEQLVRASAIGTDAGPLYFQQQSPIRIHFPIPYPYAGQNIYFGFDSSRSSAVTVTARIFYTVKNVSDKYFFRVAQSLLS